MTGGMRLGGIRRYVVTAHAIFQAKRRHIALQAIREVLAAPEQRLTVRRACCPPITVPRSVDWFDVEDVAVRFRVLTNTQIAHAFDKASEHLRDLELSILEEPSRWIHVPSHKLPGFTRFVRDRAGGGQRYSSREPDTLVLEASASG